MFDWIMNANRLPDGDGFRLAVTNTLPASAGAQA
jgi:hypothetical protein